MYLLKTYDKTFEIRYVANMLDRKVRVLYDYLKVIEELNPKFPYDKTHLEYLNKIESDLKNFQK